MTKYLIELLELSRILKKLITIFLDIFLIFLSCYIAETVINQAIVPISRSLILYFFFAIFVTIFVFEIFGFYKNFLRHFSLSLILNLIFLTLVNNSLLFMLNFLIDLRYLSLNFIFQQSLFLFLLIICSRLFVHNVVLFYFSPKNKIKNTIIFGTDFEEIDLSKNLNNKNKYNFIGFLENDRNKIGRILEGLKIYSFKDIAELSKKIKIQNCLIIKNKFDSSTYWQLEKKLQKLNIKLIKFTNINLSEESTTINFQNTKLKEFDKKLFKNKTILVTGAAGSIGKEICLQLKNTDAKKIIGIDLSEYLIAKFNQNNYLDNSKIEMILADVTNFKLLNDIFEKFKPSFIFHAAANKHVDLVENNYKYSIYNNLTGVYNVLKISSKKNYIKKFVFISTDKAIESTNYMGASKMIGEILTNYFALKYNKNFSSVRFGNVIGSSGSFLEIIKDQISKGGPITITDKKASRYFMTISDAVNLVLHTISFSSQGGTYVLRMGDPINIFDLTKKILSLNNLKIKDATNPSGDIKIKIIGLKKGEKLHEKLYNKNSKITKTNNTLIDYEFPNTIDKSIVKNILIFCESSEKNHTEKSIKELLSYFKS